MRGSLFLCTLIFILAGCSSASRGPSSILKLVGSGSCTERIRVFFAPNSELVRSLDDFLRHTSLHVRRNRLLANELIQAFPDDFGLVDGALVEAFLKNHDQSKLNPNLTKNGRRFIGERLYEFYGLPNSLLSEAEKQERILLVKELNLVDDEFMNNFFIEQKLVNSIGAPDKTAKQLLKIEKIVDLVDRGSSPVTKEEFARKVSKGSIFMSTEVKMYAEYLERNYDSIVFGYEYNRP